MRLVVDRLGGIISECKEMAAEAGQPAASFAPRGAVVRLLLIVKDLAEEVAEIKGRLDVAPPPALVITCQHFYDPMVQCQRCKRKGCMACKFCPNCQPKMVKKKRTNGVT